MTGTVQDSTLNRTIREHLKRRNITQQQLGAVLGVTQTQVSARLRGAVQWRVPELRLVAAAIEVPAKDLIAEL